MTSIGAGPWGSLEKFCRECLKVAFAKAVAKPYLQGWKDDGVRKLPENLLYDPTTCRITALLDYDFASILHPAYEFFLSFGSSGGQLLGWPGDKETEVLRTSKLTGVFPSPLPTQVVPQNGTGMY
ncbi:hypothetical protein BPAE_0113g00260 [Botrytis paeoniae]|uniref:Aminoglycoside phosphotransferase domain-containing protein n=1 Tax=Botrytis paeoniae TaxID=278948 RepID=A0A4Z1FM34_9HELO|nr:hypothetical protein BPAE_0113g00260 [Botrytis paeoniae]